MSESVLHCPLVKYPAILDSHGILQTVHVCNTCWKENFKPVRLGVQCVSIIFGKTFHSDVAY